MPHDRNGLVVAPGDIVTMKFRVKNVHANEDFCNCDLESIEMMPGNRQPTTLSAVNTRQVERVTTASHSEFPS